MARGTFVAIWSGVRDDAYVDLIQVFLATYTSIVNFFLNFLLEFFFYPKLSDR